MSDTPDTIPAPSPIITIDDFQKIDLRIGTILSAEPVPKSNKLLRLSVDLGEGSPRTILAGIGKTFKPEDLVGTQATFVVNLPPRAMMGVESHGMILAAGSGPEALSVLRPTSPVAPGSKLG
jgi:methionyl-tRNA synthetase